MKTLPEAYGIFAIALIAGLVIGPLGVMRFFHRPPILPIETPFRPAPIFLGPSFVPAAGRKDLSSVRVSRPSWQTPTDVQPLRLAPLPRHLDRREVLELAGRCAPTEPSSVLASIAEIESANHPFKIGLNEHSGRSLEATSQPEAAALATSLIAKGRNIDLGLAQINSNNLPRLGLSIKDAFDSCRNLAAAAVIMTQGYEAALKAAPTGRSLLQTAYSFYNTGDASRGIFNGYVARIEAARQH